MLFYYVRDFNLAQCCNIHLSYQKKFIAVADCYMYCLMLVERVDDFSFFDCLTIFYFLLTEFY